MNFKSMNSGFLNKVLIIFLIGLVCRVGLNTIYDIEVFKDFGSFIALVCYGVMVCSSVVVYELPSVNFYCFNLKFITQAIKEWSVNGFNKDKIFMEGSPDSGDDVKDEKLGNIDKDQKEYNLLHRKSSGEHKGKASAGVTGLYSNSGSYTGRVSAGVSGLYGESSRSSSRPSTSRGYVSVEKEEKVRIRDIRKISANNSEVNGRVSGFRSASAPGREDGNVYHRSIYNASSGNFIDEVKDISLTSESFIRKIGNVSLTISEGSIIKIESEKVLSSVKYVSKSLKEEANPFIGSWDVEAFTDRDGYAKVYALGFAVLGEKSNTYYLDSGITSEQLVINCLNDMLTNKYNGFTFYTHNFGRYDSTFLLKILKEENIRLGSEHYKLKELCRDNKILKLTIKIKKATFFAITIQLNSV